MAAPDTNANGKEEKLISFLREKLRELRARKTTGALSIDVDLYQGGITKSYVGTSTSETIAH